MLYLFKNDLARDETIWAHDLDAWQNCWFDEPKMLDVGVCHYSQPKINGGSVFWKPQARGILEAVVSKVAEGAQREEPTLQSLLTSELFRDRVTILNSTFNVGCSGWA